MVVLKRNIWPPFMWRTGLILVHFLAWGCVKSIDLTLVGYLDNSDSLSCHASSWINCLHDQPPININLFKTKKGSKVDLSPECTKVFNRAIDITGKHRITAHLRRGQWNQRISGVVIYTDPINQKIENFKTFQPLCNTNVIHIASSVYERTQIPPERVAGINTCCDAVIVPDAWLVEVYKNSGVTCPIFALPLALDLKSLLNRPIKKNKNPVLTYGFSGLYLKSGRKNQGLLIQAFMEEFNNNPHVILKIHGKSFRYTSPGSVSFINNLEDQFELTKKSNISVEFKELERKGYEDFLASLDCYVTTSKGEGFSIIPREVLALGIPCIITNNTAQSTICSSGFVRSIKSEIPEEERKTGCGYFFNTEINDVREALQDVYQNYDHYLKLAHQGREWVKQYLPENLMQKYRNLVKPRSVILGNRNEITDDYLMTDSPALFNKYKQQQP